MVSCVLRTESISRESVDEEEGSSRAWNTPAHGGGCRRNYKSGGKESCLMLLRVRANLENDPRRHSDLDESTFREVLEVEGN